MTNLHSSAQILPEPAGRHSLLQAALKEQRFAIAAGGLRAACAQAEELGREHIGLARKHPARLAETRISEYVVGPNWARAVRRLASMLPSFASRPAQGALGLLSRLPLAARGRVHALRLALALGYCRGLRSDAATLRSLVFDLRAQGAAAHWAGFWQERTLPDHAQDTPEFYRCHSAELRALMGEAAGGRVLEIGCGNGALFPYLGFAAEKYRGVDFSPAMLDVFRRQHPAAGLVLAEGSSYRDGGQYDLIFSNGVAQSFSPAMLEAHLAAAQGMLAPGGVLLLGSLPWSRHRLRFYWGSFHGRGGPARLLGSLWHRLVWGNAMGRWYSPEEIRALGARHGFTTECAPSSSYGYRLHAVLRPAQKGGR